MRVYSLRSIVSLPLAILLLLSIADCARVRDSSDSPVEERIVVDGRVTRSDSGAVAGAVVRSAASQEARCDEHTHLGRGEPEVVRAGSDGRVPPARREPGSVRVHPRNRHDCGRATIGVLDCRAAPRAADGCWSSG